MLDEERRVADQHLADVRRQMRRSISKARTLARSIINGVIDRHHAQQELI